jgi:hypothetical protein
MCRSLRALALLAVPSLSCAQSVVVASTALTPVTCQVAVGALAQTQTLPAGTLAATGSMGAVLTSAAPSAANFGWTGWASPTEAVFTLTTQTQLAATGQARVGPAQVLITFTGVSAAAMPVRYEASVQYATSSTLLYVDLGNNGTVDWYGSGAFAGTVADLAAQPLLFRVLFDDQRLAAGDGYVRLTLRVVPDRVHALRMATDCGIANAYSVSGLFDTTFADLEIRSQYTAWHVLGLQTQPALLPPALTQTTAPCLVIPSPDAVLRTGTIWLPVPLAVRPITLHTQLVDFAGGLRVSDTFHVVVF